MSAPDYLATYPGGYWGLGFALYIGLWLLSAGAAAFLLLARRSDWVRGLGVYAGCAALVVVMLSAPIRITPPAPWDYRLQFYWENLFAVLLVSVLVLALASVIGRFLKLRIS